MEPDIQKLSTVNQLIALTRFVAATDRAWQQRRDIEYNPYNYMSNTPGGVQASASQPPDPHQKTSLMYILQVGCSLSLLSCPISGSDESCDRAVSWLTVESFCLSISILVDVLSLTLCIVIMLMTLLSLQTQLNVYSSS